MDCPVPLVTASVTLLPELPRPRRIADRKYRPHIVIGPITQRRAVIADGNRLVEPYLGVCLWSGPDWLQPGVAAEVSLALMYYDGAEDLYASVVPGATFTLREGPAIVGYGQIMSAPNRAFESGPPSASAQRER
jgi:hypothetical protein